MLSVFHFVTPGIDHFEPTAKVRESDARAAAVGPRFWEETILDPAGEHSFLFPDVYVDERGTVVAYAVLESVFDQRDEEQRRYESVRRISGSETSSRTWRGRRMRISSI